MRCLPLKRHPQRKLYRARRDRCGADPADSARAVQARRGVAEAGVVGHVEGFAAKLDRGHFTGAEFLHQAGIQIPLTRSEQDITARIAEIELAWRALLACFGLTRTAVCRIIAIWPKRHKRQPDLKRVFRTMFTRC